MKTNKVVKLKRAYEGASESDGRRILVDRIWPRGVTKKELRLDAWIKDLAPSVALRKWFGHDPARWHAFKSRYFQELDARPEAVARIAAMRRDGAMTLVFAAKDTDHNNAVALRDYLERRHGRPRQASTADQHARMATS